MTRAFDKTLEAIGNLEDAITEARTQKLIAEPIKDQDLEVIIRILEKAQNIIIDAIIIFEKHERMQ